MAFQVENFLNTTVEGANSTKPLAVPEGEYVGVIDKLEGRTVVSSKTGEEQIIIDLTWKVDDPAVAEAIHVRNPTVRQSLFLDITPEGNLDMGEGRNVQLGKLREAVGQNGPRPWSMNMLVGQAAKIVVKHRKVNDDIYADVKGVAKL